jgi:hypothetical protein
MPKDRAENIDRYKIRGGQLNEYEFEQNEGELTAQEHEHSEHGGEGLHGASEPNSPQNVAERIREVERHAHEIVERRRAKQSAGASSKKGAAKKGSTKRAGAVVKKASKKGVRGGR